MYSDIEDSGNTKRLPETEQSDSNTKYFENPSTKKNKLMNGNQNPWRCERAVSVSPIA